MSPDTLTTAAQVLWQSARRHPNRICLTDLDAASGPISVSYAQLVERVAAVAGGLRGLGHSEGDRVALLLPNSLAYVEAYLGAVAAGLVVVPLNVRLVREDYTHMLRDSGSQTLVTTADFLRRIPELAEQPRLRVIQADSHDGTPSQLDRLARAATSLASPTDSAAEDAASLMYTSGTTGAPKAVVLSHRSWRSVADTAMRVLDMADHEITLHVAPLTHGAGFLLLPTLIVAGHNLLCASFDPARTLDLITRHGVTAMFVVPSMIRMMLDAREADWSAPCSLRRLYYAGSPIDPPTMRDAIEVFPDRMIQSFAQMESPMFFTALTPEDHAKISDEPHSALVKSAGRVLPGVELRFVDPSGSSLPAGEAGEILARAPQTMNGYWNRPEETAETLAGGWLHTGDVGYLGPDGYLYLVDRKKDMIVTGGSNVYAREVEEVLLSLAGVKDAAVIGLPHRVWGEAVTAVLVSSDGIKDSEAVIASCRAHLAGYRVPKQVVWVDELPRNAYGKVLKRQIREGLAEASPSTC